MFPNRVSFIELVEFDVLDFDATLGMDLLHACFASINCRTNVVRLNFPNELVDEFKGGNFIPCGCIISCLKACKMISKGFLYHIVRFPDPDSEVPHIESVPVVSEFL